MEKLLYLSALLTVCCAATGSFNYEDQAAWADLQDSVCGSGTRQSPIRVISGDSQERDDLMDLDIIDWGVTRDGHFENLGTNVEFMPNDGQVSATTRNHQGDYNVLQFHLHWGATDNIGSEHVVGGTPASAEIHFVHRRSSGPEDAGNAFAVVGVMAVADDDAEITGIWNVLNATAVQEFDSDIDVSVRYSDLLPSNLSYYYYEGSLTTPPCSEVVQWFLLKETIAIPSAYLEQLRNVERNATAGNPLTFNYRETQDLNGRTVYMHTDSGVAAMPLMSLTALFLLVFVAVYSL